MTLFDASVLFGAVDVRSPHQARSRHSLLNPYRSAATTEACLTEAMHLAGSRIGWRGQAILWSILNAAGFVVLSCDMSLAQTLMTRYQDVPMDFADATLVALSSSTDQIKVATFDSDFLAYRRDDGSPVPLLNDVLLGWE